MRQPKRHRQSGVALLVTLVLIALTALLAFSSSETVRLQQRLSSNDLASQIAFQAAEAALREAIEAIKRADGIPVISHTIGGGDELNSDEVDSWLENAESFDFQLGDGEGIAITKQPRYAIAHINVGCLDSMVRGQDEIEKNCFRIYAQGFGPRGKISRIIEARYAHVD